MGQVSVPVGIISQEPAVDLALVLIGSQKHRKKKPGEAEL